MNTYKVVIHREVDCCVAEADGIGATQAWAIPAWTPALPPCSRPMPPRWPLTWAGGPRRFHRPPRRDRRLAGPGPDRADPAAHRPADRPPAEAEQALTTAEEAAYTYTLDRIRRM